MDEALDKIAENLGSEYGRLRVKYQQEGVAGIVDYLFDEVRPKRTALKEITAKIGSMPESRIRSLGRSPGVSSVPLDNDLKLSFDQVLDQSADFLASNYHSLEAGTFNWQQAFSGRMFNVPLSIPRLAQQGVQGSDGDSTYNISLWGQFDYSKFADSDDNSTIDGRSLTYTAGVDSFLTPSLLGGISVSTSNITNDYTAFNSAMKGEYEVDLTVASPYINWDINDSLSVWSSLGYGRGKALFSLDSIGDLELASIEESAQ